MLMAKHRAATLVVALMTAVGLMSLPSAGSVSRVEPTAETARDNIPTPEQFFGFEMGTTGRLAGFSKVLSYFDLVAERSDKVESHFVGKTTMGNDYTYLAISSPQNLRRMDRIVQINQRLANPEGLSDAEARRLTRSAVPIHLVEATIHSTEVGNGQAIVDIVHRLATERSEFTSNVLNNSIVVLVPSQNPDGQHLVVDYFNQTAGTDYERVYPDLYHKYTGHDDNRDWFMFTQTETRYRVNLMQRLRPVAAHLMHQKGGGSRIFVPPYSGVKSPDIPPNGAQAANAIGQEAARQLTGDDKSGVSTLSYPIWWTADVAGWFSYQGTSLYLSEIASVRDLAYPVESDDGAPLGPQLPTMSFVEPYDRSSWTLEQIVDYAEVAAYAGMEYVADHGDSLMYNNLYQTASTTSGGEWTDTHAYVIPRRQRDHYATYDLLKKLEFGEVEINRSTAPFVADGRRYRAGSYVIEMAQPRGRFARQVLRRKDYPDYRLCDECPVSLPYSDAGPALPLFLGVEVDEVMRPFDASLEPVDRVEPRTVRMPREPGPNGAYLLRPTSYGVFRTVDALQDADIATFRAGQGFRTEEGRRFPAGTFVVPPADRARGVLQRVAEQTGLRVRATGQAPSLDGFRLKADTRIGLFTEPNNMPAGWLSWLFDQWGTNYQRIEASDFEQDLSERYDVIILPHDTSKADIVDGLDPADYPEQFAWAYGVGEDGWRRLRDFVREGGTLLAMGSAVETADELLDLPIEPVVDADDEDFNVPGSFLAHRYQRNNPVAWGMPARWPVWFENDQAYRITDASRSQSASRYPTRGELLESGYAAGADVLRGAANMVSHRVGDGYVVTYCSQVTYRTWPRATFIPVFNAIYHGPAEHVGAGRFAALRMGG